MWCALFPPAACWVSRRDLATVSREPSYCQRLSSAHCPQERKVAVEGQDGMALEYQQSGEWLAGGGEGGQQLLQASLGIWARATLAPALPVPNLVLFPLAPERRPVSTESPTAAGTMFSPYILSTQGTPWSPSHQRGYPAAVCECFGPVEAPPEQGWAAYNVCVTSAGSRSHLQELQKLGDQALQA